MKWSDGAPFTADDFLFWYEDVIVNDELTPAKPRVLAPGGTLFTVTKVDDLTIRWEFPTPYPAVLSIVAARDAFSSPISGPYAPRHFLEQYHAAYNANADSDAKAAGYDSWNVRFSFIQNYSAALNTPELPLVHPWTLGEVDDFGNKHYLRNPYYWKVDIAGNQLPYADGITKLLFENREVLDLKIVSGEIDIASRNLPVANFSLYKNGEQEGDYSVILGDGVRGSASAVQLNQTVTDPVKREVFQNEHFKQAMSPGHRPAGDERSAVLRAGDAAPDHHHPQHQLLRGLDGRVLRAIRPGARQPDARRDRSGGAGRRRLSAAPRRAHVHHPDRDRAVGELSPDRRDDRRLLERRRHQGHGQDHRRRAGGTEGARQRVGGTAPGVRQRVRTADPRQCQPLHAAMDPQRPAVGDLDRHGRRIRRGAAARGQADRGDGGWRFAARFQAARSTCDSAASCWT